MPPSECSEDEINNFITLVSDGGEVTTKGLKARIMNAFYLALIYHENRLIGTAALKIPDLSYTTGSILNLVAMFL